MAKKIFVSDEAHFEMNDIVNKKKFPDSGRIIERCIPNESGRVVLEID